MRKLLLTLLMIIALTASLLITPASNVKAEGITKIGFQVTYGQSEARQMAEMLNAFRATNGSNEDSRCPLTYDYDLEKVAMQRAAEIAIKFDLDHIRPDGNSYKQTLADYGFDISPRNILYGENILFGTEDSMLIDSAFKQLSNDEGNRALMLGYYTAVGIGHIKMEETTDFWVQVFADEGKNYTYVAPVDGIGTAYVYVSSSLVESLNIEYTSGSTSLAAGTTASVPVYTPVARFKGSELDDELKLSPVVFESEDDYVQASDGKMTGLKEGNGTIKADYLGQSVSCNITVTKGTGTINVTPTPTPQDSVKESLTKGSKFDVEGITYRVTSKGKVEVYGLSSKKTTAISVPASVKYSGYKYNVVKIADSAFSGCNKLEKVKLGSNIKTIGAKAFKGCVSLTQITIPKKVTSIGKQAFYGCSSLENIKISGTYIKKIGSKAFAKIKNNAIVSVPSKSIENYKKMLKSSGLGSKVSISAF